MGSFDGTLAGGAVFAPGAGVDGGALRLTQATNSYVDMGNVLGLTDLPGAFSIAAWFRTLRPGDAFPTIASKHQTGLLNGYILLANREPSGITDAVGRASL